jgi:ligand-binding sensor domain-containing protein
MPAERFKLVILVMPRKILIGLLTAHLLLTGLLTRAQYYFETLTEQQGLSDNRVTAIFKDRKGFMWFGTASGLNRYNGHSFRVYRPGQQKFRLMGEFITGIAQDSQDRLWISTKVGLNVLNVDKDSLHIFSADDERPHPEGRSNLGTILWDVKIDKQGRVWVATDSRDLCYYDPVARKFFYKPWKEFAGNIFPELKQRYFSINKIYLRADTALWLGTTLGLFSYNIRSEKFHYYGGEVASDFTNIHEDLSSGRVYFTQESGNLQVVDLVSNRYEKLSSAEAVNHRRAIAANLFPRYPAIPISLPDAQVKAVYIDDHEIAWLGSNKGITRFDPRLNRFSFKPVVPMADSVPGNMLNNIYYSETDSIYFGISNRLAKVFTWTPRDGYKPLMPVEPFDPFMNFPSFYTDTKNQLWLLSAGGIYQYDRKKKTFFFFANPAGKENILYTAMKEDGNGNLWLGTYPEGLFRYDVKTATWGRPDTVGGFESRIITSIHFDKNTNRLWVGAFDYGLHRLNLATNTWTSFHSDVKDPRQLFSPLISDISSDSLGNTWVATQIGGLSKFDGSGPKGDDCINLKIENGLPDNTIFAAACDTKGNIWFSSYKGITCIDTKGRILKHFDNRNGLPYENYNSRLQVTSDGCIITAVRNGFIRFHPDSVNYSTDPFPVVITDCRIKDSSLARLDSFLTAPNRFSHTMNEWQFEFAALNYTAPADIRYYYKLDGYDQNWVDAGTAHTAKYTNLDNGHYKFRVKALHPSGMYSANEAVFSFSIAPPFWKTWWFLLLSVASVAAIVYFIYRYQLNKKLEVERLRIRISRDLHDDIGSALTSINVLSKVALSKGGANMEIGTYLSQIKNAASDTMESMSDIVWAINPENDKLEAMISRMKEFAAEICEAKQVDLDFVLPKELEKISFDAAKRKNIFLIFKESVNNAIKYSQCTRLYIGFEKTGNHLLMEIKDNGRGFDLHNGRSGNGLKSMKERATVIGAAFVIQSKPGDGTSVKADIPLH